MFQVDNYAPTKVVFGAGRLKELATVKLPGKMALICMSGGGSLKRLGILDNVLFNDFWLYTLTTHDIENILEKSYC